jgi:hypothetical protein
MARVTLAKAKGAAVAGAVPETVVEDMAAAGKAKARPTRIIRMVKLAKIKPATIPSRKPI